MLHVHETRTLLPLKAASTLTLSDITAQAAGLEAFDDHERVAQAIAEERIRRVRAA